MGKKCTRYSQKRASNVIEIVFRAKLLVGITRDQYRQKNCLSILIQEDKTILNV